MKRIVAGLLVAAFATTSAFAGTVGTVTYDRVTPDAGPGTDQGFDVSLQTTDVGIDALDLVLTARNTPMNPGAITSAAMNMVLDPGFTSAFNFELVTDGPPLGSGNRFVTANGPPSGNAGTDILLGRLTIDTTGLPFGTYEIFTDTSAETAFGPNGISGVQFQGNRLPVLGVGSFNVVPEPATLGLLALGGLAVLRRRKNKKA